MIFENAEKTYDLFIVEKFFLKSISYLITNAFHRLSKCNVRIRILVKTTRTTKTNLIRIIHQAKWPDVNLTIKATYDSNLKFHYAVIDSKEVWIALEPLFWSTTLVENNEAIIRMSQERFERFWLSPQVITIFEKNSSSTYKPKRKKQCKYIQSYRFLLGISSWSSSARVFSNQISVRFAGALDRRL